MGFLVQLLVNALILLVLEKIMPRVKVSSFGTAVGVALVVGFLNATVGFLLRLPLNILTLGLLSFLVRLFVTAVMIKIADKFFSGFEVEGFTPALIIAVVMAIVGTILSL
ncbi:phage holin family protein [Polluticoccus soli]|uniref:phage holin family protein n=1 Tax=Polluticoccus soli TaxID=3034150 RepID=UPI0023E14C5C|nr:phage holin family protein [Flavipsychrobacter sp. JY13-12]